MQASFSDLEYAGKKKLTRRERFLAQIDAVTPWAQLEAALAPFYPAGKGPRPAAAGARAHAADGCGPAVLRAVR